MEYINLGRTGLKVSRICLGTMTLCTRQKKGAINFTINE
jgi:aryl-alcohol dehydrogenase-like predicted oxidoreductase